MGEDAKPEMPVFFCLDTWAKTPDATCLLKNVHKTRDAKEFQGRVTRKNFRDAPSSDSLIPLEPKQQQSPGWGLNPPLHLGEQTTFTQF